MSENRYRARGIPIKKVLLIASISFAIPFGLHFLTKKNIKDGPIPVTQQDIQQYNKDVEHEQMMIKLYEAIAKLTPATITNIVTFTNNVVVASTTNDISSKSNNILLNYKENEYKPATNIHWLDSPVMQTWVKDEKTKIWQTALPYKDSMRSTPTLIFGLREDGVVVWKRIIP